MQAKKINSLVAIKRHIQYIGRLMRNLEDISTIELAYKRIIKSNDLNTTEFHLMENWRKRLMSCQLNDSTC